MSDAIVIGEGWISEHYFTTEATKHSFNARVRQRRKEWQAAEKDGLATPRSRFLAERQNLDVALAGLDELTATNGQQAADDLYDTVLDILGLTASGLRRERNGQLARVSAPGITSDAPLAIVRARPVDTVEELLAKDGDTLPAPVQLNDEGEEITSAARLLSTLFVAEDAPAFALVLAGRWMLLAEREKWHQGRYLATDLQLVCERNDTKIGGEIDRALTCLSADSIAPDAEGGIWWHEVLEDSVKHTVGVSQDLRDGVRKSLEIIANEVVDRRRATNLDPLPSTEANELAKQSLRFLYRILFLLYAEASPELGVLPIGAPEYDEGYSLDRLRELIQVPLRSPQAHAGTHLYDSLNTLFRLVDTGTTPSSTNEQEDGGALADGLTFNALRADLFHPAATAHINTVKLGNAALQDVLGNLLLSMEKRGKERGYISYAELGINQLGAVYEGLMAYTGFFADTDLYEVAKGGEASKGSFVLPVERAEDIEAKDFVRQPDPHTGEPVPVVHRRGQFVFRLAGRERQQSASYYTPEVLTRFTVGQALAELLDQDGETTSAAEILELTVCEPALGSGAFAIEAVRQLAEQYLTRRQTELDDRIDPDDYPRELQQVKAYLALHNVYGVDLNATAVELAEISLWLDTMVAGLDAPWFGLHLRRGNSLIGARRAVYRREDVSSKRWLKAVPHEVPISSLVDDLQAGEVGTELDGAIHHFLLPAEGWGATVGAKEGKALAPQEVTALREWRRSVFRKPGKKDLDALRELAHRVEVLWQLAYRRLEIAEQEIRRAIPVWQAGALPGGGAVQREQIEAALADANGAYRRLRRVMDAWCALWFWPLTEAQRMVDTPNGRLHATPPTLEQWIEALQGLLGRSPEVTKPDRGSAKTLSQAITWDDLGEAEDLELQLAGAQNVEKVLTDHPWLVVCERVAEEQGFFHWNLDFATVFARGGFDLQVGNPPWVRPRSDVDALLAEGDPWWDTAVKPSEAQRAARRDATLAVRGVRDMVLDSTAETAATAAFVGSVPQYPHLKGLQPDLYRCFMEQTWRHNAPCGTIGLIHPETHFTDEKAGLLRKATYKRLRRHWQFMNALMLFEVHDQVSYGVHVYSAATTQPQFIMATSLYHPDTAENSLDHDGMGPEPGLKDEAGNWDLRPHRDRIISVTRDTLATWHAVLEAPEVPIGHSRMVYTVNRSVAAVLEKLSQSQRIGDLNLNFSRGWDETIDRKKGYFETSWGTPDSWDDVILQGPHLHVATPFYKSPNATMRHNQDWSAVDLETLDRDAIPTTAYKPAGDQYAYDVAYTDWGTEHEPKPARDYYRLAWRNMAANTGERTLIPALIPPGAAHINGISSLGLPASATTGTVLAGGVAVSLLADFSVRVAPKSTITATTAARLPLPNGALQPHLLLRALRLNCVTDAYADLWSDTYDPAFTTDSWTTDRHWHDPTPLGDVTAHWTPSTPLRLAADRRQALVEIDALVALMLGLSADELCTIYRTQFPVLYGYDRNTYYYDATGRRVPKSVLTVWHKKAEAITEEERSATNEAGNTYIYELPFLTLDREADMRQAYDVFAKRLEE